MGMGQFESTIGGILVGERSESQTALISGKKRSEENMKDKETKCDSTNYCLSYGF